MSYRLILAAVAVLALQACAPRPTPQTVEVDPLNEGIAKTCTYSPVQPTPGASVEANITMTNDGWCAFRASEKLGSAYLLGLVKQRPQHGELQIRKWNGESRVEYTANPGYTGSDRFTVALRPQGGGADATIVLTATVTRGEGVAAAPAPEPEQPTTTRRTRRPAARTTTQH